MTSPVWGRVRTFVQPYGFRLAFTLFVSLLGSPLALVVPLPLKIAIDSIIGTEPLPAALAFFIPRNSAQSTTYVLLAVGILIVVITALVYLQSLGAWIAQTWIGEKLVLDLRAALFKHAQRLSLTYHDRTGTMDSVYRIQYDAQSVQHVIVSGFIPLANSIFTLCGMVIVTAYIDWELATVALCVCPLLYWITLRYGARLRQQWFEMKDLDSAAMSIVQEVLSAVRVVKAFGQEDHEERRFVSRSTERVAGQIGLAFTQGKLDLAVGLVIATGTSIVLVLGVVHTKAGLLTLGELLIVMAYLAQIYEPLRTITKKIGDLQSGFVGLERSVTLLDELPEVKERERALPLARASGGFQFESVSFQYGESRPILSGLNFVVPAGSRVGIQGRTGAGKTTFISLLTRFYDPTSGSILLDGVDLRDYRLKDLRGQFAIVLQDPILFSTTIAENIAYGRPSATEQEIIQAARDANAHDFICALPAGYQTQVGERGMRLSGGERQRISIARAFLKNAPILLLDEPTSSVDVATETAIMDAMSRLMENRTVFMIAHRLTTLSTCNIRLELAGGTVNAVTEFSHPAAW